MYNGRRKRRSLWNFEKYHLYQASSQRNTPTFAQVVDAVFRPQQHWRPPALLGPPPTAVAAAVDANRVPE